MIIFDCNGVLVDSEPIAMAVVTEELCRIGIRVTPEAAARLFSGRRPDDIFAAISSTTGNALPQEFEAQVARVTLRRLRDDLRAMPHVAHALTWLHGPKAVASSSPFDRVRLSLECTDLLRFFEPNLFSASEVEKGKPAPDLFLHVADNTGTRPDDCIVIEDSPAGVAAATAAGMMAIGFVGGGHAAPDLGAKLTAAGARTIVTDMRALKGAVVALRGF